MLEVALLFLLLPGLFLAIRTQAIIKGKPVPKTGWFNRLAHRWAAHQLRAQGRMPSPKSDRLHPDRSADEVDARRNSLRRDRMNVPESERLRIRAVSQSVPRQPKPNARSQLKRLPNAPKKRSGRNAQFVYVDADGVVTDREIANWSIAGGYIEGFCVDRQAIRTFRLDRIDEWISSD